MKTIGIIGGMSFESTITYYKTINETINNQLGNLNSAKILLYSVNFEEIANLQKNGEWEKAAQILGECAKKLELGGADFILIATNTMHKIFDQIQKNIKIPLIHIAQSTAKILKQQNIHTIGLLGTQYTMMEDFYKNALKKENINTITPNQSDMQELSDIIFNELCKGQMKENSKIIQKLKDEGAQGIVLGCTEIGLLISQEDTNIPIFDTALIHALDAVNLALKD
ncbi:aspartate/glutamate racemase family protein [Campylobacter coli]|nr:aspartate/glutamate racemase family protein [Campylobacter coli]EAL1040663.1 aspartate/glutamate racemase family protein [Campylobacter coli]